MSTSYTIEIDVFQAVQDFYPGLSIKDVESISTKIVRQWDYSNIYDDIADQIESDATELGIDLEGKDGIEEEEVIIGCHENEKEKVLVLNPPPSRLFP